MKRIWGKISVSARLGLAVGYLVLIWAFASACTGEKIIPKEAMSALLVSGQNGQFRFNSVQSASIPGPSRFDLYFTEPGTSNVNWKDPVMDDRLVDLINGATTSIDFAAFDFDRQNVVDAIIQAKARGIPVRGVGDGDNIAESGYAQLSSAGITMVNRPAGSAIMHHKFVIVDNRYVWAGSANLSDNDTIRNNNNAFIIESTSMATTYRQEFEEMYIGGRFGPGKNTGFSGSTTVNGAFIEYYTGPKSLLMNQVISRISSAQSSVHFMIFTFTRGDMKDALLARKNAGIPVMGVFDQLQANGQYSEDDELAANGVPTWIDGNNNSIGNGGGILHHKVAIIDGNTSNPTVITGSFNWTDAADQDNDENIILIHSPEVARLYLQEFCAVVGVASLHPNYTGNPDTGCGGKVSINEALPNPMGTDTDQEYVEIINSGIGSLNIGGWTLEVGGTVRHTFPQNYTIPANGVSVVYSSGSHASIPGAINASTGALNLVNSGGTITLKDSIGTIISTFTYGGNTEGTSVNRNPDLSQAGAVANHNAVAGASGLLSPGKRADQSSFAAVGAVTGPTTPSPSSGELLITQFATRGATSATDEFVEVYNNTDHDLDAGGIRIQYQAASCGGWSDRHIIPSGTVLKSGQYYLAANPSGYISPASGLASNGSLSTSGFADNGHLQAALAGGTVLDRVSYGTGLSCQGEGGTAAPNHGTSANGNSVIRKPTNYSNAFPVQDTNNNSADFAVGTRTTRNGSIIQPSYGIVRPATGELIISQFATRGTASASDEFVEIYNNTNKILTIEGSRLQYQSSTCGGWSDRFTIPSGVSLAPGKFYLIANSSAYTSPASGPAFDGSFTSALADNGLIRIINQTSSVTDTVAFGTGLACTAEGSATTNHGTAANNASMVRKPGDLGTLFSAANPAKDTNDNLADFGKINTRLPKNKSSAAQPSF